MKNRLGDWEKGRQGEKILVSPAAIVFLLCLLAVNTLAQRATGTISGRVTSDDGQPIPHAKVNVFGIGGISKALSGRLEIVTDENGSFQADGLDPAPYSISATAPGYVLLPDEKASGQLGINSSKYTHVGESVTIRMLKGGVITGRVTTALDEPVIGIGIEFIRVRDESGRLLNGQSGFEAFSTNWRTDDRGVYRIYGLAPGAYVVSVGSGGFSVKPTPFAGRMKVYHPSATRDNATEITVRSGEEVAGMDIRYRSERGSAISGKVTGAPSNAQELTAMAVTVITLTKAGTENVVATTTVLPIGGTNSYGIYGVPNGEYEIYASRPNPKDASVMVAAPRRVVINGGDISGVDLALTRMASISGSLVMEKTAVPASAPSNTLSGKDAQKCKAERESYLDETVLKATIDDPKEKSFFPGSYFGNPGIAVPDEKGAFTISGLVTGRHFIEAQLPGEHWYVKSILWTAAPVATPVARQAGNNGLTVKAGEKLSGVQVVVAEGAASVKGKLVAEAGAKLPARIRIHLLPAEVEAKDDLLRFAEIKADENGSFNFSNLAPGKYLLVARAIPETESVDKPPKPVAWNAAERAKLRKEAEVANAAIELKACQRVADFALRFTK